MSRSRYSSRSCALPPPPSLLIQMFKVLFSFISTSKQFHDLLGSDLLCCSRQFISRHVVSSISICLQILVRRAGLIWPKEESCITWHHLRDDAPGSAKRSTPARGIKSLISFPQGWQTVHTIACESVMQRDANPGRKVSFAVVSSPQLLLSLRRPAAPKAWFLVDLPVQEARSLWSITDVVGTADDVMYWMLLLAGLPKKEWRPMLRIT